MAISPSRTRSLGSAPWHCHGTMPAGVQLETSQASLCVDLKTVESSVDCFCCMHVSQCTSSQQVTSSGELVSCRPWVEKFDTKQPINSTHLSSCRAARPHAACFICQKNMLLMVALLSAGDTLLAALRHAHSFAPVSTDPAAIGNLRAGGYLFVTTQHAGSDATIQTQALHPQRHAAGSPRRPQLAPAGTLPSEGSLPGRRRLLASRSSRHGHIFKGQPEGACASAQHSTTSPDAKQPSALQNVIGRWH